MEEKKDRKVMQGDPRVLGVVRRNGGYNFAAEFPTEKDVRLLLYKKGQEEPEEEIPMESSYFTGQMASVFLPDFKGEKYESYKKTMVLFSALLFDQSMSRINLCMERICFTNGCLFIAVCR